MSWSDRVGDALALAWQFHRDQFRKLTPVPYITHVLAVAAIVGEYGGDEDQFIAALLHDAIEDCGGADAEAIIRKKFGAHVTDLVRACTDADTQPKPAWRPRKEAHLARTRNAAPDVRLLMAADKLHNLRCTLRDVRTHGPEILDQFKGRRAGTLWYYRAMYETLAAGWAHPIIDELRVAVEELERAAS